MTSLFPLRLTVPWSVIQDRASQSPRSAGPSSGSRSEVATLLTQTGAAQGVAKLSLLVWIGEARRLDRDGDGEGWLELEHSICYHSGLLPGAAAGAGGCGGGGGQSG